MTESFLHKLLQHIRTTYQGDLSELCIVLPNRRAGLFLKKYLSSTLEKPIWAPTIFSIEDFVITLSKLELLDNTALVFELYEIYKGQKKEEAESLDEFFKWAPNLINDFSEIDSYLVDGESLFGNLSEVKEMENWSLASAELTDFQQKYLDFWQSLGILYKGFRHSLISKRKGYQGLIYRKALENIEQKTVELNWGKILFAGFNALNACEEKTIHKLLKLNKTEILWDSDIYYLNNKAQEAGKFLRKHKESKLFNIPDAPKRSWFIEENLLSISTKKIDIIGAAKNILQAKAAGDILAQLSASQKDMTNTAVVLADENLLFPVLHSVPDGIGEINVTMGYPLKYALITELSELLFNLHETPVKLGRKGNVFYHKDVIKLLKHPFIKSYLIQKGCFTTANQLIYEVIRRNMVFVTFRDIEKITNDKNISPVLFVFFDKWEKADDTLECLEKTVDIIKNLFRETENPDEITNTITLEFLATYLSIIKRVKSLQHDYKVVLTTKTLRTILSQLIKLSRIPFYGEPLNGLQIMGMLETRTLDFENVILLSANENILPSGKSNNSFIPFDIRRAFGLPTHSDKDAIFAYHFYRLMQRATNVYLLYNTEADNLGSGEKSRFLTQITSELPKINPNIRMEEKTLNSSAIIDQEQLVRIEKTEEILETLKTKAQTGFSPSLLNIYRNCGLRFYFHAIAGIKETEEVEESIGADTLGTIIHDSLFSLYQPFIGEKISPEHIKGMLPKIDASIKASLEKQHHSMDSLQGKNLLIVTVAKKFIHNFLEKEIAFVQKNEGTGQHLIIRDLEKELAASVIVKGNEIKIKGTADRIDQLGNTIRVIDYKTGKADKKELEITQWSEMVSNTELNKSFQLLMYALLYSENNQGDPHELNSGIITFRELSARLKTVKVAGNEKLSVDILEKFKTELITILENIFDPSIAFTQTEDHEVCVYCAFKTICNR